MGRPRGWRKNAGVSYANVQIDRCLRANQLGMQER